MKRRKRGLDAIPLLLYITFSLTRPTLATDNDLAGENAADSGIPVITEHPLDVIVAKGEPATLNCAASGEDLQILWYKDGELVKTNRDESKSHRLVLQTGALFLLRVNNGKSGKDADSGTYYCVARNRYGEARSREAVLRIAMLRDDFLTRPRNVQAVLDSRAILECAPPKGFPEPVVTWKKDDQELRPEENSRITLHPAGNLVIDHVQRSDSGFYQCIATNMVGERISNPARLSVFEKPYFLQKPQDMTVENGTAVRFECSVGGDPQPTVVWRKKNGKMPTGRASMFDGKALRIDRVQSSDEGEYECYARNPAGAIEAIAKLRVHAPPVFERAPADRSVELGETATFECLASGNPTPARFWSREGQQELFFPGHVSADGRVKVNGDGLLTITDVRPADQGNYVCAAMNAAGSNVAKAMLKVLGRALTANPPPVIVHGHSNQTLMVSASAILPCQATGRNEPAIAWLKDGLELDMDNEQFAQRFVQLTTGSLQISDLRKTDTGVYTCRARNSDGESTWTASLNVEEHSNPSAIFSRMPDPSTFPTAPGQPHARNISDDSVDLEWTVPDRPGATPITGYFLQYFNPELGQTWFNVPDYISGMQYRVKNLRAQQNYVFVVRAENANGIGPPSMISDVIRMKEKRMADSSSDTANLDLDLARQRFGVEQLIRLEEVKTLNATAMKLTWKRRRQEPLIEGYYLKWRGPTSDSRSWVNVSGQATDTAIINGLLPYTTYEFFVIPYHRSVQGMPSNSLDGTTDEAPPTSAPADVRVRMMNMTTLRISWRPPLPPGINGILRGFQVVILGNGTKYNRNISTNERAASVTLFHLVPGMTYRVQVAARTGAGTGVFHDTQIVTMNEATLLEHLRLASGGGGSERFLRLIRQPWFIACVGVLLWIALVSLVVLVWWRRKKSTGKAPGRGHMPFIKINDGSVLTARDALWMDHTNFTTAQRALLLNGSASNGSVVYSQPPSQPEYYLMEEHRRVPPPEYPGLNGGIDRSQSPHHYHYAAANNSMATFYPGMHQCLQYQDDPSPYATTTLVMGARQKFLREHMLRGPILPSNPVPSGPPPRFADVADGHRNGVNSRIRSPHSMMNGNGAASHHSGDSPPHTDISYVQSSDGTGGSSNGRSKAGTMGKRRSPKHTLIDNLPPPPPGAPPPASTSSFAHDADDLLTSTAGFLGGDEYDSVSDALLIGGIASNSAAHLPSELSERFSNSVAAQCSENGGAKRSRNGVYRPHNNNGNHHHHQSHHNDDSQRSSLMLEEDEDRLAFCTSSDADEENSEDERAAGRRQHDGHRQPFSNGHAGEYNTSTATRPSQPCMGVSASALTQSTYDSSSGLRNGSRMKSLPRTNGGRKDLV